jgi:hypothetical protein
MLDIHRKDVKWTFFFFFCTIRLIGRGCQGRGADSGVEDGKTKYKAHTLVTSLPRNVKHIA